MSIMDSHPAIIEDDLVVEIDHPGMKPLLVADVTEDGTVVRLRQGALITEPIRADHVRVVRHADQLSPHDPIRAHEISDALEIECEGCGAEAGEPCRPGCLPAPDLDDPLA